VLNNSLQVTAYSVRWVPLTVELPHQQTFRSNP
jgi:hypothetical protein